MDLQSAPESHALPSVLALQPKPTATDSPLKSMPEQKEAPAATRTMQRTSWASSSCRAAGNSVLKKLQPSAFLFFGRLSSNTPTPSAPTLPCSISCRCPFRPTLTYPLLISEEQPHLVQKCTIVRVPARKRLRASAGPTTMERKTKTKTAMEIRREQREKQQRQGESAQDLRGKSKAKRPRKDHGDDEDDGHGGGESYDNAADEMEPTESADPARAPSAAHFARSYVPQKSGATAGQALVSTSTGGLARKRSLPTSADVEPEVIPCVPPGGRYPGRADAGFHWRPMRVSAGYQEGEGEGQPGQTLKVRGRGNVCGFPVEACRAHPAPSVLATAFNSVV